MIDKKVWEKHNNYEKLMRARAEGKAEEMEAAKSLKESLDYKEGMTVLDVGCGTGYYYRTLSQLDKNIDYTGTDITEGYLETARKNFPEAKFIKGDLMSLPFDDNSFDTVICVNVLQHLKHTEVKDAIKELIRVSRGNVVLRVPIGDRNYIVTEVMQETDNIEGLEGNPFDAEGEPRVGVPLNIYTLDKYFKDISTQHTIRWKRDTFGSFDNRDAARNSTATRTVDDMQVSGCLVLDWHWITIKKMCISRAAQTMAENREGALLMAAHKNGGE